MSILLSMEPKKEKVLCCTLYGHWNHMCREDTPYELDFFFFFRWWVKRKGTPSWHYPRTYNTRIKYIFMEHVFWIKYDPGYPEILFQEWPMDKILTCAFVDGCQPHSEWDIFYPRTLHVLLDLLRYPGYILSRFFWVLVLQVMDFMYAIHLGHPLHMEYWYFL